jgi:putative DNA primase/helicase
MIDFDQIDRAALSQFQSLVQYWIPGGSMKGREYVVRNPTRADDEAKSFSISTSTGVWKDFATGDGGPGPLSLYAYIKRLDVKEAAKELANYLRIADNTPPPEKSKKPKETWTPVLPVPPGSPASPTTFPRFEDNRWIDYPIEKKWEYLNVEGKLCGFDCKIINKEGKKEILPLTYCKNSLGEYRWKFIHFKGKRPLYNGNKLSANPNAIGIGVEGCKCAEALQNLFEAANIKEFVAVTWPGGCESAGKGDWSPVRGHVFYMWPDNDRKVYPENHELAGTEKPKEEQPGFKAGLEIISITKKIATSVKLIDVPGKDKPDTWDVADAIYIDKWNIDKVLEYINRNLKDPPDSPQQIQDTEEEIVLPFKILGCSGDSRFYLMSKPRRIKIIGDNAHTSNTLLTLARREFWMPYFPGKFGVSWEAVASFLLHHPDALRSFDHRNRRGRGGWMDKGRAVYHMGTYLVVDGQVKDSLDLENSSYIYEESYEVEADIKNPSSDENSQKLLSIIERLHFTDQNMSSLLAGFIALAPICGALEWRPHVWLTGGPGTGKSTVMGSIVIPCLGSFSLFAGADSTAAGMRQFSVTDGAPIVFDESEGQTKKGTVTLQEVLKIARQASSNNGSRILKGSASHKGVEFEPRSSFLFGSTGVNIYERADETRISIAELCINKKIAQEERDVHWENLEADIRDTLTPEFCSSLRARMILNIQTIRKNCRTFTKVVSEVLANKRAGDQLGALLAGEYALFKMKEVSIEEAREIIGLTNFNSIYEKGRDDHEKLLDFMLQKTLRVDNVNELSIEEIIRKIMAKPANLSGTSDLDDNQQKLYDLLKRNGIRIEHAPARTDEWVMWISDSHGGITRMLEDTSWPKKWSLILKRLPGALITAAMRFIGSPTRATGIPLKGIVDVEEK